jgi:preprotein translocase subunit SecG
MTKDTDTYFNHLSDDAHGYIRFFRRLTWFAVFAFIVVAIAVGIVLSTARSAS